MVDFALSMGAFLLIALGLGMAFTQALAGLPAASSAPRSGPVPARTLRSAFLLVDGGALLLTAILAVLLRAERPEVWFILTTFVFLAGAIFCSWLTRPGRNKAESVTLATQAGSGAADWMGFGARLVAFAALATFALLTRPPCPPCAGG
ncbi:hypothetical protein [Pedomonas mirosovicensis]|uniref:hypothetical protein n=1 Tax=Pedomonas mirosovicensis TaxID=2908641 RepID=UPI00216A2F1C|nr:hypothetical protein [Pedomonas mirosovicensis]MCH8686296.1 hypothetical protein [Pedomonas mirosovicensis]